MHSLQCSAGSDWGISNSTTEAAWDSLGIPLGLLWMSLCWEISALHSYTHTAGLHGAAWELCAHLRE